MWDDEDNNPYGSFNRRDSEQSDVPGTSHTYMTLKHTFKVPVADHIYSFQSRSDDPTD